MRSWWRHEQQSIRMALGAAAHHSAQQYGAPRGQKTATRAGGEGEKVTRRSTRPSSGRLFLPRRSSWLFGEEDAEAGGAARVGHGPYTAWPGGAAHRGVQDRGVRRSFRSLTLLCRRCEDELVGLLQ